MAYMNEEDTDMLELVPQVATWDENGLLNILCMWIFLCYMHWTFILSEGTFCDYQHTSNTKAPETYNSFQDYADTLKLECNGGAAGKLEGTPGTFEWTPNADTPKTVYYQVR